MERQMVVRIDEEMKGKFFKIARMEGKTASEKIREMIERYVSENDLSTIVDGLWNRISNKLEKSEIKEEDITRVIKEARKTK